MSPRVAPTPPRTTAGQGAAALGQPGAGAAARAQQLYDATLGKTGTDEGTAYRILKEAFAHGEVAEVNRELGRLLREKKGVSLQDNGRDSYLRYIIDQEMNGSERARAVDLIEAGYDRGRSSDAAYVWEGITKQIDTLGDDVRAHPVASVVAAGAVLGAAVLAPGLVYAAGVYFAYEGVTAVARGLRGAAKSPQGAERGRHLVEVGGGVATLAMTAGTFFGITKAVRAGRAATATAGFLKGARVFATEGGLLARSAAGAAAVKTESAKSAVKCADLFDEVLMTVSASQSRKPHQ